jgi:hypothetical protein
MRITATRPGSSRTIRPATTTRSGPVSASGRSRPRTSSGTGAGNRDWSQRSEREKPVWHLHVSFAGEPGVVCAEVHGDTDDKAGCAAIDEALVHLEGAQLGHIAGAAELRNMNIHVLPASDANAGLSGSFSIAGADSLPETLLMKTVEDHTTQDRALVRRAAVIFDLVRRDALPRVPSRAFILEASDQWKTR